MSRVLEFRLYNSRLPRITKGHCEFTFREGSRFAWFGWPLIVSRDRTIDEKSTMTWKESDALVRKTRILSETKISGSRTILKSGRSYDQDQGSWRGYLSHTWAGLLATALPFHSLAGLSISFVVRTFLIGQRLIRLKIGHAWSESRSCPNLFRIFFFLSRLLNVWDLSRVSDYQKRS